MNSDYIRLAYERTVVADCRRHLMEKRLAGGGTNPEPLICESLPYDMREVPPEVFAEVVQWLESEEKRLSDEMAKYEFRKRDERQPLSRKPDSQPPVDGAEQQQPDDGTKSRRKGRGRRAEPEEPGERRE